MGKSKEPIRLRKRLLKTGLESLYLDIYVNGKRSYEYLSLYLVPEKTRADKDKNKETLKQELDKLTAELEVRLFSGGQGRNSILPLL